MFCPRCTTKLETINHTFMECPFSRKIWFGFNLNIKFPDHPVYDFKDWLKHIILNTDSETLIYTVSVVYNLWFTRNKFIFEDSKSNAEDILDLIRRKVHDYKTCNTINQAAETMMHNQMTSHNRHQQSRAVTWRKSDKNIFKINTDVNLSEEKTWGLGALCRDESGEVFAAATWHMEGFNEPAVAEAYGIYLALEFTADCGFMEVTFESDCEQLIRILNDKKPTPNHYMGNVIKGI
jgi:hypothetical protein